MIKKLVSVGMLAPIKAINTFIDYNYAFTTYAKKCIDKEILLLYFGFEDKRLTQKQIASIYNITQSRVSFIISKNLDKIKKILEKEKYIDYRTKNKRIRKKCK